MRILFERVGTLLAALVHLACSQQIATFGIASPAGVMPGPLATADSGMRVTGKSCATAVLFIPLDRISIDNAMADAVKGRPGAVLTEVTVRETSWFALLVQGACYIVEGTLVEVSR